MHGDGTGPARPVDDFEFLETTITELHTAFETGAVTARRLTTAFLERIAEIDASGPQLGSVIEIDPEAEQIAAALDEERARSGPRGALHGIPVMVKDNIATAGSMQTTAGSLALVDSRPVRDAEIVTRLRDAGAVIVAKTNLSEWANIRSPRSTSGWSARGGLTRNPYALDRNTSGSSSGSAVAVAANLCTVAVGTETDGSIVSPASINGLVGIKPTVGLVSGDGIIPISLSQDTPGPMARTVADAAALLTVLAHPRVDGEPTAAALDDTVHLAAGQLDGARLGVVRSYLTGQADADAMFEALLGVLAERGAVLVDPVDLRPPDTIEDAEFTVLLHELKHGLAGWFASFVPDSPISSLADVIAWNRGHADSELAWFGQEFFEIADAHGGLDDRVYLDALDECRRWSRDDGIDAAIDGHGLDALIAPTGGPAWLTDLVNGDNYTGSFSTPAAVAGYPHITVPMGQVHGLPVGVSLVGKAWSEPTLIGLARSIEQIAAGRRPPTFARSLPDPGA